MSISAREQKGNLAPGVTYTELNIRDDTGTAPLIRVEDEFVAMLEQHVRVDLVHPGLVHPGLDGDGQSVAGFLLGTEERGALRITGFQPLAAAGLHSLQGVVNDANPRKAAPNTVGFYRAARQLNHLISRDDLVLFREYFPGGSALFLQVRLSGGPVAAGVFYLGQNGSLQSDRRSVEWPVNLRELGAGEVPPEPAVSKDPKAGKRQRRRGLWRWMLGSAAVAFAVTVLWSLWPLPWRPLSREAPAVADAAVPTAKDGARAIPDRKPPAAVSPVPAASSRQNAPATPGESPAAELPAQVSSVAEPLGLPPIRELAATAPVPEPPAVTQSTILAPAAESPLVEPPAFRSPELRPRTAPVTSEVLAPPGEAALRLVAPPQPRLQVTPAVSPLIMRRIQGFLMVSIRVDVDEAGQVTSAVPVSSSSGLHSQLAAAVVDAVRRWQFEPARQGGRAVRGQTVLHFKYVNP